MASADTLELPADPDRPVPVSPVPTLQILTVRQVMVGSKPGGSIAAVLAKYPQAAEQILTLIEARDDASATARAAEIDRLNAANQAEIDQLTAAHTLALASQGAANIKALADQAESSATTIAADFAKYATVSAQVQDLTTRLAQSLRDIARLNQLLANGGRTPYLAVVKLPQAFEGSTSAGVRQAPTVGGDWIFDLLSESTPGEYDVDKAGLHAPASLSIATLDGINAEAAAADITAFLFPPASVAPADPAPSSP